MKDFFKSNYNIFIWVLVLLLVIFFWKIFLILLFSAIFAYLLDPVADFMCEKLKFPRTLSVSVILVVLLFIFIYILANFIPFLIRQFSSLNSSIPGYFNDFYNAIKMVKIKIAKYNVNNLEIVKMLVTKLEFIVKIVSNTILDITIGIVSSIPYIVLIIIFMFYFLKDKVNIVNYILRFFNNKERDIKIIKRVNSSISKYIGAQLLDCLIVGVLATIGLIILRIDYPVVLGSITGILTIIPYIGPLIGAVPPLVLSYIKFHSINQVLITGIFYFVILMVNGYVIQPKIIGDSTKLHPMVVLLLLLMGGQIFGGIGLILAVPIAIIVKEVHKGIVGN